MTLKEKKDLRQWVKYNALIHIVSAVHGEDFDHEFFETMLNQYADTNNEVILKYVVDQLTRLDWLRLKDFRGSLTTTYLDGEIYSGLGTFNGLTDFKEDRD